MQHVSETNEKIFTTKWKDDDQCKLCQEALRWLGFHGTDVDELCFKAEQMSMQRDIKVHGEKGKASAMKEIRNLAKRNEYFGEVKHESLSQEMKDRALPLLMFMVMKMTGELKSRGCARGDVQKLCADKNETSSPTPDFYYLKHVCGMISKESRDVATVDLPSFFLQTEQKNDDPCV